MTTPPAPADDALPAELAAALDRMDALLDPALDLLTAGPDSATAKGSRDDMRAIRDALAARASPSRADGWQPIETAPMDRSEVLLWREDCGPFIGSYTSADGFPLTQAEIDELDEQALFSKDWFTQWPDARRMDGSEAPTHWQHLPAPPGTTTVPAAVDVGAAQAETAQAAPIVPEALHTFLNAAAGEGLVIGGVDAADLYIAIFPERYAQACATPGATHGN